jgi:hypothetical protein
MAGKHTYNCAVCDIEKRDANHWALAWFTGPHGEPEFSVRPWDEETARLDDDAMPVCGQAHAHNMLDRFFAIVAEAAAAPPAIEAHPEDPPAEEQFLAAPDTRPCPASTARALLRSFDTAQQAGKEASEPSGDQLPVTQPAPDSAGAAPQCDAHTQTSPETSANPLRGIS